MTKPSFTIGLMWHSVNSGNLGVGALTVGNIALLRRVVAEFGAKPKFVILGFVDPGRAAYVQGADIEFVRLNTKAMVPCGAFHRAVRQCDCVIDIGGGDSFTDIYGAKRFTFLFWSKVVVLALGKPLVLAPQTIGPFTKPLQTHLAAWVISRARAVFCRDPLSFDFAKELAPSARLSQAVDVAFALPFERPVKSTKRPRIGLNVSGLLYNRGYDRAGSFGMEIDYPTYIDQLLTALSQRGDLEVILVPHVLSDAVPVDDDRAVADALATKHTWLIRGPDFADPIEAKTFIAGLDFLTAARMHACIAAYSAGVPVLPVAYSRKFAGLFSGVLDYPHLVPATGVTTDRAVSMTLEAIDKRADLAQSLAAGSARAERMLDSYCAELEAIFGQIR